MDNKEHVNKENLNISETEVEEAVENALENALKEMGEEGAFLNISCL